MRAVWAGEKRWVHNYIIIVYPVKAVKAGRA
jgi:hypothetical protein